MSMPRTLWAPSGALPPFSVRVCIMLVYVPLACQRVETGDRECEGFGYAQALLRSEGSAAERGLLSVLFVEFSKEISHIPSSLCIREKLPNSFFGITLLVVVLFSWLLFFRVALMV